MEVEGLCEQGGSSLVHWLSKIRALQAIGTADAKALRQAKARRAKG